ncbi:PTS system galactitol-specific transporter subunit IIA [Streptococcus pseudoporcinus]|uniref:PTS system galactitol-specific transporter subunit IIA n=1 Tax=Streptococcus pseudoporcinus TaxID=361101 RepID=A0A4V6L720_9STRE|nr:PTS sugar transporter subunit IIA [Streptococcus pseudoporcinus]VTS41557.1 PTS system galactitol-specific transporter subunit IIA [Streptococcus pseudoporcinus]
MDENLIFLQVSGIETAEEALTYLGNRLREQQFVKDTFVPAIIERENVFPTGLQFEDYGVALPHTDAQHVTQTQVALMTLEKPVTFTQMASKDQEVAVQLIVMLAIKEAHSQLEMLQTLMGVLQDRDLVHRILACHANQQGQVLELLSSHHIL